MRIAWMLLVCLGIMVIQVPAQKTVTLKTKKDKVSYSIGMNIGHNFKAQSIDVDLDIVLKGMKDALSDGKLLMTEEEAQTIMNEFQKEMGAKQESKNKQLGETNMKEGAAFLAENKKKPGVVTLPSGLQYKILKEGNGPKPTLTQTFTANYRGTLINGKEFDSSYRRGEPLTYPVNKVIKGWAEALQMMSVGSKWQLFVPSELAYGIHGMGQDIGPNATLIFEIELLSFK